MFEQSLLVTAAQRRNPWSFAASITVQSVLVGAALVVPLAHIARLDMRPLDILYLPRPIGIDVEQPKPVQVGASTSTSPLRPGHAYKVFQAPSRIPSHITTGPDLPNSPEYPFVSTGPGMPGGSSLLGALDSIGKTAVPPPAPTETVPHASEPAAPSGPLRIGGGVQSAKLIFGPRPAYPPLAKQARISGEVHLAALISADGHIRDLRVLSGHPMLVPAAIEAVSKWVYQPTLLNRQPVEVLTDIMVNFILNQ